MSVVSRHSSSVGAGSPASRSSSPRSAVDVRVGKGAAGEQALPCHLVNAIGNRAALLNDRAVKGTRGNIDHIVVAASGVWVIDAKNYTGLVEHRNVGGWFRPDFRLIINRRDKPKLADGLGWQVTAVQRALDGREVPVFAALCLPKPSGGYSPSRFTMTACGLRGPGSSSS
jgi:hypothetical protein